MKYLKNIARTIAYTLIVAITTGVILPTASAQSPTSAALGFNVFVNKGAELDGGKSDGPVAMGGDLTLTGTYNIAHKEAGSFTVGNQPIGLLVGGKINYSKGTETKVDYGYAKIGNGTGSTVWYVDDKGKIADIKITGSNDYDSKPYVLLAKKAGDFGGVSATVNPVVQGNLVNFNQAFTTMQTKAQTIGGFSTNIQLFDSKGLVGGTTIASVNLDGGIEIYLKTGYNVLNVTGAELNSVIKKAAFKTNPDENHIIVINVNAPGSFIWNVWDQLGVANKESPYILYNFYNTTNLQIAGDKNIEGTLYAPFADVIKTNVKGNIEGQVIAQSFKQTGGNIINAAFIASVPDADPNKQNQPTIGATSPVYSNKSLTSVKLSFTKGNGAKRIVIARKAGEPSLPINARTYTANAAFGLGAAIGEGHVVYNGNGNNVTVTGLQAGANYYFSVVEYNGENTLTEYNTNAKLVSSTTTLADADGDNVPDSFDDYPADATRAFNNMHPATGFSTLMFEDRWPFKGDYDFNDLVIDYKINTITTATNSIAAVEYIFLPKASGATSKIGFAFQLDGIAPSRITSVTGTKISSGFITNNTNGTEAGHAAHANIVVFENSFKMFKNLPPNADLINTYMATEKFDADTIKVIVTFQPGSLSINDLTFNSFNPYIFTDLERGKEIHLADRLPSAKMNTSYFGTGDDDSKNAAGKYFKTKNKLPWALNIVTSVPHVQEGIDFIKAYTNFTKWAVSDGAENRDWYMNMLSNRNTEYLFTK